APGALRSRSAHPARHARGRVGRPERVVMNAPFHCPPKSYPEVIAGGLRTACIGRTELAQLMVKECHEARALGRSAPKLVFHANGQVISLAACDPEFRRMYEIADHVH